MKRGKEKEGGRGKKEGKREKKHGRKRRGERERQREREREGDGERGRRRERKPVVYRGGLFMTMREVKQREDCRSVGPCGPRGTLDALPFGLQKSKVTPERPWKWEISGPSAIRGASSDH